MGKQKNSSSENCSVALPPVNFPIVGIGASAGGLDALEQFFKNVPVNSGLAFVVIQHLDPTHVAMLPDILQRFTQLNVIEVTDSTVVAPDSIYVIPSNKSMSLLNGILYLFEPIESRGLRLPIDFFFRSLANDRKGSSIGIILSGMGADGSLGLKAIKEQNGLVLVQEPASAQFDSMPLNAMTAAIPDVVAPANELPLRLIDLLNFIPQIQSSKDVEIHDVSSMNKIILLLREQSGHDFSHYKKNTIFRRIERRKAIHQIHSLKNYLRFCQENRSELDLLFKELLIGVTNFFRDEALWKELVDNTLPTLIASLPAGTVLRAWVTACSTGEEAYSLAIAFSEVLESMANEKRGITLQIFATDLDNDAIVEARKGVYSANIVSDVSPERLSRYFKLVGNQYNVHKNIREMVVFANQNLIKDPPFTRIDILTCRNVLIYMEPDLQRKVISMFNYSLNSMGIMVLGSAERLSVRTEGFEELNTQFKIYKRTSLNKSSVLDFPSAFRLSKPLNTILQKPLLDADSSHAIVDQLVLQQYAPASVLVNGGGDILYMIGKIGKFLEPVAGKANWNVLAMARKGIIEFLPGAIREAKKSAAPVLLHHLLVDSEGHALFVNLTVQQLDQPISIKGCFLLVFRELLPSEMDAKLKRFRYNKLHSKQSQQELEFELQKAQEDLKLLREDMQASQEELKSTNEEFQSTNEELQSINEELTTSKEEMQSMNEELQTVNAELQAKISDFVHAENDMLNLFNSNHVATLFVDKELKIRRYTEDVTHIFRLRPADMNRPFTELVSDLDYPEIELDALQVLKTLIMSKHYIPTKYGRWFSVKIMPYRTHDDRIDGVVLTFTDVTESKKLEISLQSANDALLLKDEDFKLNQLRYQKLFEGIREGILILDPKNGTVRDVNPCLLELLGCQPLDLVKKSIWEFRFFKEIFPSPAAFFQIQEHAVFRQNNLTLESADGRRFAVDFVCNLYKTGDLKELMCVFKPI